MKEENLELRMYFFVPYQLTGIQQGIQAGHAALEYASRFGETELFKDFAKNWKTWVVLNGGTTNKGDNGIPMGTLNQIYFDILKFNLNTDKNNQIDAEVFFEPDLNLAMTSVCFICDERVFNRKKYPDFNNYAIASIEELEHAEVYKQIDQAVYIMDYDKWVEYVGGPKNVFLRNLLEGKRLA